MDLKDRCQVYLYIVHVRPHDTFNTQQASYQFCRGPCDACAADHVINSSRPSASVFSSPAFNYYAQCARRGGGRRPGNEARAELALSYRHNCYIRVVYVL